MVKIVPVEAIERRILHIRGKKIILDRDLAVLYGVATKVLNQAVTRNLMRFPQDFMFRLTDAEKREVVTNCDHLRSLKFSPKLPYVVMEKKYDSQFSMVFDAIRQLLAPPPESPKRRIGFHT